MDADDDARTVGARLRQIRNARGKSLEVIAGLAGISRSHLSRIERGERALDSRSTTVALANALHIAPSELTTLPVPAPGNGITDSAIEAVRHALMAVNHHHPGGIVLPVDALRERVDALVGAGSVGDQELTGRELPVLVRDLHTTLAAGRDVAELLDLAVLLHTQATIGWLRTAGASVDLREQASLLARRAAEERDTPTARGLAAAGAARVMLSMGAFDLAQAELDSVTVPMTTALDLKDYDLAVAAAEGVNPQLHCNRSRRAAYWVYYGRALARVRRRDDAVMALRRAELIVPHRVQRDPFARDVMAELLSRSRRDAVGRELRGMAYRAGLPG